MKLLPLHPHGLWTDDLYAELALLVVATLLVVTMTVAIYTYAAFLA